MNGLITVEVGDAVYEVSVADVAQIEGASDHLAKLRELGRYVGNPDSLEADIAVWPNGNAAFPNRTGWEDLFGHAKELGYDE